MLRCQGGGGHSFGKPNLAQETPLPLPVNQLYFQLTQNNSRVNFVNRLLDEVLEKTMLGVRLWRHAGVWSPKNKTNGYCEDGVHFKSCK